MRIWGWSKRLEEAVLPIEFTLKPSDFLQAHKAQATNKAFKESQPKANSSSTSLRKLPTRKHLLAVAVAFVLVF